MSHTPPATRSFAAEVIDSARTIGLALLPPLRTLTLLLAPIMPGGDGTQCADAREIASAA